MEFILHPSDIGSFVWALHVMIYDSDIYCSNFSVYKEVSNVLLPMATHQDIPYSA